MLGFERKTNDGLDDAINCDEIMWSLGQILVSLIFARPGNALWTEF